MNKVALLTAVFVLFAVSLSNCENKNSSKGSFENSILNAEIVEFIPEKCGCCWGWKIKVGVHFIKADSLPNVTAIGYTITNPIPVIIETGKIKENCGINPDYYEIKSLILK